MPVLPPDRRGVHPRLMTPQLDIPTQYTLTENYYARCHDVYTDQPSTMPHMECTHTENRHIYWLYLTLFTHTEDRYHTLDDILCVDQDLCQLLRIEFQGFLQTCYPQHYYKVTTG